MYEKLHAKFAEFRLFAFTEILKVNLQFSATTGTTGAVTEVPFTCFKRSAANTITVRTQPYVINCLQHEFIISVRL